MRRKQTIPNGIQYFVCMKNYPSETKTQHYSTISDAKNKSTHSQPMFAVNKMDRTSGLWQLRGVNNLSSDRVDHIETKVLIYGIKGSNSNLKR